MASASISQEALTTAKQAVPQNSRRQSVQGIIFGFIVWTGLGLFDASQTYLRTGADETPISILKSVGLGLSLWYSWMLVALVVFPLSRHISFERDQWTKWLIIHGIISFSVAALKICVDYPCINLFYCPMQSWIPFGDFYAAGFRGYFHRYVMIYWAMIGVSLASTYYARYGERDRHATALEGLLADLRLQSLRAELQPHFLLNTLNSISALIHKDSRLADQMVARVGELLRLTLANRSLHEVPLDKEIDFIRTYYEVQQLRFELSELNVEMDPLLGQYKVPYLLLQPLVENAIRHGIAPLGASGSIDIKVAQIDGRLSLRVIDNGVGFHPTSACGIGLTNTLERLDQLYGPDYEFELSSLTPVGAEARILLPQRLA